MGKVKENLQKSCNCFGYNIDEGMKAYSIVELFMGIFNMIVCLFLGFYNVKPMIDEFNLDNTTTPQRRMTETGALFMEMTLQILCVSFLFLTGLLGVLVYPCGWRTRNITVCWMWIVIAPVNVVILFCLLVIQVVPVGDVYENFKCPGFNAQQCHRGHAFVLAKRIPFYWLLYLLYIPYGMAIQLGFVTWAKEAGVAVMISVSQVRSEVGHAVRHDGLHHEHKQEGVKEEDEQEGVMSPVQSAQAV